MQLEFSIRSRKSRICMAEAMPDPCGTTFCPVKPPSFFKRCRPIESLPSSLFNDKSIYLTPTFVAGPVKPRSLCGISLVLRRVHQNLNISNHRRCNIVAGSPGRVLARAMFRIIHSCKMSFETSAYFFFLFFHSSVRGYFDRITRIIDNRSIIFANKVSKN